MLRACAVRRSRSVSLPSVTAIRITWLQSFRSAGTSCPSGRNCVPASEPSGSRSKSRQTARGRAVSRIRFSQRLISSSSSSGIGLPNQPRYCSVSFRLMPVSFASATAVPPHQISMNEGIIPRIRRCDQDGFSVDPEHRLLYNSSISIQCSRRVHPWKKNGGREARFTRFTRAAFRIPTATASGICPASPAGLNISASSARTPSGSLRSTSLPMMTTGMTSAIIRIS